MGSKPILHGQVTQSLLLLPLGSSQRHDIRTARPTPNATRSRRDQGNAQPYPPPPPRGPGTTWVPQVSGTKYQAARGVEEATAKQLRPRPDRWGPPVRERERPPDILKRIPPPPPLLPSRRRLAKFPTPPLLSSSAAPFFAAAARLRRRHGLHQVSLRSTSLSLSLLFPCTATTFAAPAPGFQPRWWRLSPPPPPPLPSKTRRLTNAVYN